MLMSHRSASQSQVVQSELLEELTRRVEWLCRNCPEEMRGEAAREELERLMPRVRKAIEEVEYIKQLRRLTEEELAWRHALMLLLNAGR